MIQVKNKAESAYQFMDVCDKIKLYEVDSPNNRSQKQLNEIFSNVDTVVLVPEATQTVEMGTSNPNNPNNPN